MRLVVASALLLSSLCGCARGASPSVIGPEPLASGEAEVTPPAPVLSAAALPAPSSNPPLSSPFEELPGFVGAFTIRDLPPAVHVSVGRGLSCALLRDSSVWCWRGPGAAEDAPPTFAVPALVGLRGVTRLSIGGGWIFGAGTTLQSLGDDPSLDAGTPPTLAEVSAVSMSSAHGCAVHHRGRVRCWGDSSFGRLGTSPLGTVGDVPGVQAVEVSAGLFGGCAVERSGRLVCWGAASLIPWAPGGAGFRPPEITGPTALRGINDVVHVSLRSDQPCLVRRSGKVHCWSPEDAATLLPQNPLPADSEVRDVTDGVSVSGQMLLRKGGKLASLEFAVSEQGSSGFVAVPVGSGVLGEVLDADGSRAQGCAVEKSGRVVCWADAM